MKKIICILAAILCFAMLLTACDNNAKPSDTTTDQNSSAVSDSSGDNTTDTAQKADGELVAGGVSKYKIIRADSMEQTLVDSTVALRNKINSAYNVSMSIVSDWSKDVPKGAVVENNEREILIGKTNRKESQDVLATLSADQYVIKWVGLKLVIIGYDDYAAATAVKEFTDKYVSGGNDLVFPTDTVITGTASVQKIFLTEGADLRVMSYNLAGTTKEYATRKEYIADSILYYLPDVIGFQECSKTVHNDILSNRPLTKYYATNIRYHSNNSTANYTPILYLKDKYTNIESGVTFLRSRYTGTNTKSISWAVLERKSDKQRFIIVNMHGSLWSSNYTPPAGETQESMALKASVEWKIDNAKQMLEKITELQNKYDKIPAFTTGDYNFNTKHAAYQTMQTTGLASSLDKAKSASSGGSYHADVGTAPSSSGLPIDHVFYFPELSDVFVYKIGVTKTDLNSSDHCPVYADFKLIK